MNDGIEQDSYLGVIGYNKQKILSLKKALNNLSPEDSNLQPLVDYQIQIVKYILKAERKIDSKKMN